MKKLLLMATMTLSGLAVFGQQKAERARLSGAKPAQITTEAVKVVGAFGGRSLGQNTRRISAAENALQQRKSVSAAEVTPATRTAVPRFTEVTHSFGEGYLKGAENATAPLRSAKHNGTVAAGKQTKEAGNEMINKQPEGELKYYLRSGVAVYVQNGTLSAREQEGVLQVVYAPDGKTVYMKDLVSATASMGTWVKGTLSDDKTSISMPTGQNVAYFEDVDKYLQMHLMNYDEAAGTYVVDEAASEVTFSVGESGLALEGTNDKRILGLTAEDGGVQWYGYGDYQSAYAPFTDNAVTLPEGLKPHFYFLQGSNLYDEQTTGAAFVAIDGADVYAQGLCKTVSQAWIKGKVEADGSFTFPAAQFVGLYQDYYPIFFCGATEGGDDLVMCDVKFVYDETAKNYTADCYVLDNGSKTELDIFDANLEAVLTEGPDITIQTEIIDQQPEGKVQTYMRNGTSYLPYWGYIMELPQNGDMLEMVYAPDGKTVYLKEPVSKTVFGTWVRGTVEGNKITVPMFQYVTFSAVEGFGAMLAMVNRNSEAEEPADLFQTDFNVAAATYTINADGSITIDNTSEDKALGVIYTDNFGWTGYCDYNSTYLPFELKTTTIPENLEKQTWAYQYYDGFYEYGQLVDVAIDGDKMYVTGLMQQVPEVAVVGKMDGDKVTFASNQCMGEYDGVIEFFVGTKTVAEAIGGIGEVGESKHFYAPAIEFTLDREKMIMTADEDMGITINHGMAIADEQNELDYFLSMSFNPRFNLHEEKSAVPANPEIVDYSEEHFESWGCSELYLDVKTQDVDGRYIDPANLAYRLFVKENGEKKPFVFRTTDYANLESDMEVIPYNFTNGESDIFEGGSTIYLYLNGLEDIGVQSINTTGGEEKYSDIVWFNGGLETGLNAAVTEGSAAKVVARYNVSGVRVNAGYKGVQIVRMSDGMVRKVLMR